MAKDANKPLQIGGVDVCFPHQPYGVQKVFMNQVVRAIDHEENALLEAPTGCGKTLSLLCGALAWQSAAKAKKAAAEQAAADKAAAEARGAVVEDAIEDSSQGDTPCDTPHKAPPAQATSPAEPPEPPVIVPKIYYATRTHSQIAQVCTAELLCAQSAQQGFGSAAWCWRQVCCVIAALTAHATTPHGAA